MANQKHLIAPIAFAIIGGVLTGGAGWAISAGFLIGSWMFQPPIDDENSIFDPGANEIPNFNQALRGVTIAITFGTNRVASNIVWQKNFNTIRHESTQTGGGGKGGGSSMGQKGGGPSSTQVTYEYKWDLLMHTGMSDEVGLSLFGGWLGAERLSTSTLLAIVNNSSSGFGLFFLSNVDRSQNASLSFDEGFFHGSLSTSGGVGDNWDHFETEEGQPFRWPYAHYIGFKQLNLGSTAAIPQLSWEIGPGSLILDFTGGHVDYWDSATGGVTSGGSGSTGGMFLGEDGVRYQFDGSFANSVFKIRNVDTGVDFEIRTDAEFDADATALGLDPGSQYAFTNFNSSGLLGDKGYILASGEALARAFDGNVAFVLYKINSSGVLVTVGGYQGRTETINQGPVDGFHCAVFGEGTDDDPIIVYQLGSAGGGVGIVTVWKLPTINEFIDVLLEDDANKYLSSKREHNLESIVDEIKPKFGNHTSYRDYAGKTFGFMVPTVTLGGEWKTKIMFYIGKSDIEWHIDNPAHAQGSDTIYDITGSHPSGGIFSITLTSDLPEDRTFDITTEWTDEAANFIDRITDNNAIPFSDTGTEYDGETERDADDYDPNPTYQKLTSGAASGATLVIFWKNVSAASPDRGDENANTRVRVFLWNPLAQTCKMYATENGPFATPSDDWGVNGAWRAESIGGWFDEASNKLLVTGYADGGDAGDDLWLSDFGDFDIGGGEDVLPPYIIRQILSSEVYGVGVPASVIDTSTYELALAYCDAEGIRVSVQYRREDTALTIINDLLSLYGGYLLDTGGEIKFGLQQFTASEDIERTIDNDHLVVEGGEAPVVVTRGARQDTFNKVRVNYFDRDLEYRQNYIEIADEVDMDLNGTRAQEFPAKYVMSEATANKLAVRALWSNLYARDIYDFKLGPKDADLEPGDVITLVDSHHPSLNAGKQVRIVTWIENDPLKFEVRAVDEIQYIVEATLSPNSQQVATKNNLFANALPAADFTMYELPKEFQGASAQVYVGYRQQSISKGAHLYMSADGESFAQVQEAQPFILSGILAGPLPVRDPGYADESVQVYLMPDTFSGNWSPSSSTWAQTIALDDVSASGRALGQGLLWAGSEMMAYEGVNLLGQNHYRFDKLYRGWGGTHIQGHSSGETWHKHGGGIFNQGINEDKIGTIIHYKVAPFNFAGMEFDIASIDARTYQIKGTFFRPQNQAPIRTFVQSPGSFLTIQSEDLGVITKKNVIADGSNIHFAWPDASRDRGYGTRGYGDGGYGRFETDTTSHQYRVEVLSSDGSTVVRCTTVSALLFVYSTQTNSEDFNGWSGDFSVKITPFNEFGDALRNRTKILELFE